MITNVWLEFYVVREVSNPIFNDLVIYNQLTRILTVQMGWAENFFWVPVSTTHVVSCRPSEPSKRDLDGIDYRRVPLHGTRSAPENFSDK